jgi:hypothetical protein
MPTIKKSHIYGGCCGFVLAVSIILAFICIGFKVEQNEYAVVMNTYTMQFRPDVLSQGMYILKPGDKLIKFERIYQTFNIDGLECLTGDEVLLNIHVLVRYQYARDALIPIILKTFDTDAKYKTFLNAAIRSTILNSCLEFTALEYYEKRAFVDSAMFDNLMSTINQQTIGSSVEYFQLVDIRYPDDYNNILHQKQNIAQGLITAQNNRNTAIINANTIQMEAQRTAGINIINAQNIYNITIFNAETQKQAILLQWSHRADAFKHIMIDLNYTPDQLVDYIKADVVRTSTQLVSSV